MCRSASVSAGRAAAVAEVDVVEAEIADGLGPGGVDRGQCEDDPDGRVGLGRGDGLVDVVGLQRQDRSRGVPADTDPDGGVAEDRAIGPAVTKQRPQRDDPALPLFAAAASRTARTSSRVTSRRWS